MYTGPKLTNENLVFGYDTGYGLNQGSSTRHYKGEPATNLITSGLPGYFGSGGETLYKSNHYGLNSDSGVFQRNFVSNPATADDGAFNNNAGLYKNFTTAALSSNTEYVLVSFDFYMITPYVRHSSSTVGLNGYLGVLYTDGSTGNHGWNTSLNTPNAGDDWNNNSAYIGQWRKIALYVDLTDAKTPASISSMYIYNDKTVTGEGVYTNFIITEHGTLPTGPVLYTSGTRSDTASLIDLKGEKDLTLSAMTYDSTGQPDYDGTNDYINLGNYAALKLGFGFSLEFVVRPEQDKWMYFFYKGYGSNNSLAWGRHSSGDDWFFSTMIGGSYQNTYMGTATVDEYCHLVATYDGANLKFYENGILKATVGTTHQMMDTNTSAGIGGADRYWNGEIPVAKVYNKVLSTEEVVSNFNAYKNRFNI